VHHVDHTFNRRRSRALGIIEGEIPSPAASMTVIDSKSTTPEDTKSCIVCLFLKNTILKGMKTSSVRIPFSNCFVSVSKRSLTNDRYTAGNSYQVGLDKMAAIENVQISA